MKSASRLINGSNGSIVGEAALLLLALTSGPIAGAAVDVYDIELPGSTPRGELPNVLTTPYIGYVSKELYGNTPWRHRAQHRWLAE